MASYGCLYFALAVLLMASSTSSNGAGAAYPCTEVGRFQDPASCRHFFLCSRLRDGFVTARYPCPVGSSFDPNTKRCSLAYQCSAEDL